MKASHLAGERLMGCPTGFVRVENLAVMMALHLEHHWESVKEVN
jgi:hypothetical protein